MSLSRRKSGVQRLVVWAATLAVLAGLVAQPAQAAAPRQAGSNNPNDTSYHVSCRGGVCTVGFDLGEIELESVVPADMPVKLDVPAGMVPFLPKGAASLEISDRVKVTLPWGSLELREGDFSLHLDENGKLDRLHGKADEIVPSLNVGPNFKLAGPFSAEIGYDLGSTLDNFSTVLDPDRRYLFLDLGSGFSISATVPGSAGNAPLQLSVPEGDHASILIDPQGKLMYVDGRLTLYQMADLGLLMGMLGGNIPANLPLLSGVVLPTRTTVGIGALLSGDMSKNFIQISGGMGLNGGPLAKLLRLEGEPLGFDGTLRVDANGLLLGGVVGSSLNPNQLLDSKGELSVYIPFSGELPYVRAGGRLSVPAIGIAAEGAQQLGGGTLSEDDSTNAMLEATADAARSWWNKTGSWMSNIAAGASGLTGVTLNVMQQAAVGTKDAIAGGAVTAWNGAGSAAGAVSGAAGAAGNAIKDAAGATGSAIGGAAAAAGGAVKDAAGAAAGAAGAAGSAVGGAVGGAAAGTGQTATQAWDRTVDATACAAAQARALWCKTTGWCPVEEVVCGE